ncbi:MAG: hypothetical protein JKX81_19580 [Arenicella sp.]|nr:hypothetical protein [Arenicella sp.]
MSTELLANIIGMVGTLFVVGCYFLMQLNKLDPKGLRFNLMNLLGAIFLLLSLLVHFNLASFVIELFWIAASSIGIYNHWQKKSQSTTL